LGVLILFDGDKEGSPTPVTSGQDKVMFGIQSLTGQRLMASVLQFRSRTEQASCICTCEFDFRQAQGPKFPRVQVR